MVAAHKRWIRGLLQGLAIVLVVWGIYHTLRKSSRQLSAQRDQLSERAAALLETASQSTDALEASRLQQQAQQLKRQVRDFWKADLGGLTLAGLCYAAGMLPASLYWRKCLYALGQSAPTSAILWAYFYGNLGKYFPGKAMVIVLRLAALDRYGVKRVATSISIFIETLTMMAVGGAVAAACLILLDIDWRLTLLSAGLLVGTFVPTWPPLLRQLLPRLQKGVDPQTLAQWTDQIDWRLIAVGWGTLLLTWSGFGLSLLIVLQSLPSAEFGDVSSVRLLLSALGACALAVVLGFVSLIPGGAGVREVVLATVLTPVVGPTAALCSALWVRIVWLGSELAMVGLTGLVDALQPKSVANPIVFHGTVAGPAVASSNSAEPTDNKDL